MINKGFTCKQASALCRSAGVGWPDSSSSTDPCSCPTWAARRGRASGTLEGPTPSCPSRNCARALSILLSIRCSRASSLAWSTHRQEVCHLKLCLQHTLPGAVPPQLSLNPSQTGLLLPQAVPTVHKQRQPLLHPALPIAHTGRTLLMPQGLPQQTGCLHCICASWVSPKTVSGTGLPSQLPCQILSIMLSICCSSTNSSDCS